MDRKTKGQVAEAQAVVWFVENGYEVYLPAYGGAKYDLLVSNQGKIARVSVKYTSTQYPSGSWKVELRNISRRAENKTQVDKFDKSLYDLIAVYIGPEKRIVVVEASKATENLLTIKNS